MIVPRAHWRAWAEARIVSALERCGYRNVRVRWNSPWLPFCWSVEVEADHPDRPYETTTGISTRYSGGHDSCSPRRLVAWFEDTYDGTPV